MPYTQLLTASNINDYDSFVVVVFYSKYNGKYNLYHLL